MFADRLKVEGQLEQVIVNIIRDDRQTIEISGKSVEALKSPE